MSVWAITLTWSAWFVTTIMVVKRFIYTVLQSLKVFWVSLWTTDNIYNVSVHFHCVFYRIWFNLTLSIYIFYNIRKKIKIMLKLESVIKLCHTCYDVSTYASKVPPIWFKIALVNRTEEKSPRSRSIRPTANWTLWTQYS